MIGLNRLSVLTCKQAASILRPKHVIQQGSVVLSQSYADKAAAAEVKKKDESLPDLDYNWYNKYLKMDQSPRADHWKQKFSDLRFQYLQDPELQNNKLAPIIIQDGPERDTKNWPTAPRSDLPGRVRMLIVPHEFFEFLYSKTGVTGPYVILWGSLGYAWSQEWIRFDNESATIPHFVILPLLAYHRILLPRLWPYVNKRNTYELTGLNAMKSCYMAGIQLSALSDKVHIEKVSNARKFKFQAMKEMFQMQWESEYRKRMAEAYDKVKKRLDYQTEMLQAKNRHENRHMVNWIVSSVIQDITPEQEKATLKKCLNDLKALAGSAKL